MVDFYLDLSIFVAPKIETNKTMKKRIIFVAIGLCAMLGTAVAQTSVIPVDSSGVKPNCVAYYLPKTAVDVIFDMNHIKEKPGPFMNYAARFLGISDVITTESDRWEIGEVTLDSHGVADETKHYQIAVNNKSTASNITITDDGVIVGVNLNDYSQRKNRNNTRKPSAPKSVEPDLSVLGEDALVAGSIPKMAEMAAKQIYRIRENRADLLSGESEHTPDGAALKRMLEELDKREQALVALFTGRRVVEFTTIVHTLVPQQEMENQVVCRFSTVEGLVGADDMSGSPIYITLKQQQNNTQQTKKATRVCGLYYNVPAKVSVVVTDGNEELVRSSFDVAQFGTVNYLPASMFNGAAVVVKFSETGAIRSIDQK